MDSKEPDFEFLTKKPYVPPSWAAHLNHVPTHIFSLGQFPTPIHKWNLPNLPKNTEVYLKVLLDKDPGLSGNLLVERLIGAHINLVSEQEFASIGSVGLTNLLKERLLSKGRKPYVIPVGGSNSLGTWGYIEAIREIKDQLRKGNGEVAFDDIVVACGSGGTVAGLSVGSWLSELGAKVHAFSIYYDPEYLYEYTQGLFDGLQVGVCSLDIVDIQNASTFINMLIKNFTTNEAKGLGYDVNTTEELIFIKEIAEATGVVLDPVYSGKAAYGMMKDMARNPEKWEGRKVMFIHTGGVLSLFDKTEQMASLVGTWRRLDIQE
ncbi:hypothetical protein DH2020_022273 [Rehmannia glutinosa]|uniref:Tryptophan synthase beta chain-like PALP domain-containing protein n=1 Tax=Rehmannia glutinosa TaxID=99300 RepID=A0ABR0WD87_REHGL